MAQIFKIEAHEFNEVDRFFKLWVKELNRGTPEKKEMFDAIGQVVKQRILKEIPRKLDSKFGHFMAVRTAIDVEATQTGFRLNVHGLYESELPDGESKMKDDGKDYNLWAFYEFGGEVAERKTKKGMKIQKDVASVSAIKNLAKGFRVTGKTGAIQTLVMGLQSTIEKDMAKAMSLYLREKVVKTASDAAKKTGGRAVKGMENLGGTGVQVTDLDPRIVQIVKAAVNGRGIPSAVGKYAAGTVIGGKKVGGQFGAIIPKGFSR